MKKRLLLSVTLSLAGIALASTAFAQTWYQSSTVENTAFNDIQRSQDNGVIVGDNGIILSSSDAGATWNFATSGTNEDLNAASFGLNEVYVVGTGGTVLKSTDSGMTWNAQTSNTSSDLNAVLYVDGVLIAAGDDGTIVWSDDNGSTWVNQSTDTTNNLFALTVDWAGTGDVFAVGDHGTVLVSSDDGVTWNTSTTNVTTDFFAIGCSGSRGPFVPSTCTAHAADGQTLSTSDGGTTWTEGQSVLDLEVGELITAIRAGLYGTSLGHITDNISYLDYPPPARISGDAEGNSPVILAIDKGQGLDPNLAVGHDGDNGIVWTYDETVEDDPGEGSGNSPAGGLVKLACPGGEDATHPCRAVYWIGPGAERHAFPNEKVFFSWFDNYDEVLEADEEYLSGLTLGDNVTYKPGSTMVKFPSVNTVYAVGLEGELRPVANEDVAFYLYGSNWNAYIHDISEAFYFNYQFGVEIQHSDEYSIEAAQSAMSSPNDLF